MSKYIMAIDAGTGSIRSIIFDESFNQVAVASEEWTHKEDPRYEGAIDFDVAYNTTLLFKTIDDVLTSSKIEPNDIVAISTSSMREAFVLYDENKEEIWAVSNVDARAIKEVVELQSLENQIEEDIYMLSGQTFALGAIPRLLWVKNNQPQIYEATRYITMLNDWLTYKLTGILSVEPSNGSTTGMINTKTRTWDDTLITRCGLKDNMYPEVLESGTTVGTISEAFARTTGINKDCIVAVGGGDVQLGCLGVGVVEDKEAALLGGSFWQLEYNTATPSLKEDIKIRVNCHAAKDLWQQELIAFYPGLVLRWFRDTFCRYEVEQAKILNTSPFDLLNEAAKDVPVGSNGVLCSFSSVMDYKEWKHPAPCFTNFGIDPEKYNTATFYRAILENSALVTLGHKKIIENTFGTFPNEITFASGASNSPLWCQIVSDVLGVTVKVPKIKEATALGAAFCAGYAAGLIDNLTSDVKKYIEIETTYHPNQDNHQKYQEIFENWQQLSTAQNDNSATGFLNYMWKAPGV